MSQNNFIFPEKIQISPHADKYKKILIIKPSSLGDVIHTFPAVMLLKKSLPDVEIDWVINNNLAQVLDYMQNYLSSVIQFKRKSFKGKKILSESISLIKSLRARKYDAVIDLQGLLRSSIMTFIAKAPLKVGFADPKETIAKFAYNKKISVPDEIKHAIEKNIYLVSKFLEIEFNVPYFEIPYIEKNKNIAVNILSANGIDILKEKFVIINPGARWESKRWSPVFFAKVADLITEYNDKIKVVLIGGSEEYELADKIIEQCTKAKPVSFIGKTNMIELVELLRASEAVLTNDSGPMHIAAALGKKVYALFGATDPELTGPFWPNSSVFQNKTGCIKCFKRECQREVRECQNCIEPLIVAESIINNIDEKK